MNFRILSPALVATAEQVVEYLNANQGASGFRVEEELDVSLDYRPTLQTTTSDHYIICVEVSESPYPAVLESVVLDCVTRGLPVKLYVAFPSDPLPSDYKPRVDRARSHGVGVLEVKGATVNEIHPPIALSLSGLRAHARKEFPGKYRAPLDEAEKTFRITSPAKGCALVFDEIELLSRKIAARTRKLGLWRSLRMGEKAPRVGDGVAWAKIMQALIDHLDSKLCPSPDRSLLSRVAGLTSQRNESGHKPKTKAQLIKRDSELRTRFENATHVLFDLIKASRHLKV